MIISVAVSIARFFITNNSKNDILIFVLGDWNVGVYELFDISYSTCLPIRAKEGPFEVFSNEIGEEYNICARKKIYVYLHKPMLNIDITERFSCCQKLCKLRTYLNEFTEAIIQIFVGFSKICNFKNDFCNKEICCDLLQFLYTVFLVEWTMLCI